MHTAEQAKELWCPFRREPMNVSTRVNCGDQLNTVSANVDCVGAPVGSCIAERCMAWRWDTALRAHGYCGLAGRPEVMP